MRNDDENDENDENEQEQGEVDVSGNGKREVMAHLQARRPRCAAAQACDHLTSQV